MGFILFALLIGINIGFVLGFVFSSGIKLDKKSEEIKQSETPFTREEKNIIDDFKFLNDFNGNTQEEE